MRRKAVGSHNKDQYFNGVPQLAWEFHIGGCQPTQKRVKDRRGRSLSIEDVFHYREIAKILAQTDRMVREIPAARLSFPTRQEPA